MSINGEIVAEDFQDEKICWKMEIKTRINSFLSHDGHRHKQTLHQAESIH